MARTKLHLYSQRPVACCVLGTLGQCGALFHVSGDSLPTLESRIEGSKPVRILLSFICWVEFAAMFNTSKVGASLVS